VISLKEMGKSSFPHFVAIAIGMLSLALGTNYFVGYLISGLMFHLEWAALNLVAVLFGFFTCRSDDPPMLTAGLERSRLNSTFFHRY
jgi:hypothetical protein